MSSVLITGGGKGIGLELAVQLAALPDSRISKVFVTTRGSIPDDLRNAVAASGGKLTHVHCAPKDAESVSKAAAEVDTQLGDAGLDILINNIGTMPWTMDGVHTMDPDELIETFDTNVVTAHRITAAFIPLLKKSKDKKIVMVSTSVGCISYGRRFKPSNTPIYKITKASMNMLMVQYALQLENDGFTVLAVSPGWLRTELGSSYADLEVSVGVSATKDVILAADRSSNGKFLNIHVPGWEKAEGPNQYDGAELPW